MGPFGWAMDKASAGGLAGSGKEKEEEKFFYPLNQSQWQSLTSSGNYCYCQEEL